MGLFLLLSVSKSMLLQRCDKEILLLLTIIRRRREEEEPFCTCANITIIVDNCTNFSNFTLNRFKEDCSDLTEFNCTIKAEWCWKQNS